MKNVFYFHLKLTDLYGQPNIFIPPDFLLVSSTSETHLESEIHLDNLRVHSFLLCLCHIWTCTWYLKVKRKFLGIIFSSSLLHHLDICALCVINLSLRMVMLKEISPECRSGWKIVARSHSSNKTIAESGFIRKQNKQHAACWLHLH